MDKSAIKTYAVEARRKLIDAVKLKARQLYIFEDGAFPPDEAYHHLRAGGVFLTPKQDKARLSICSLIAAHGNDVDNKVAYQRLAEDVACTWFNRLIALRIMEVNDWLPSGIRILSSREPGRAEPDAMREVERLDYVSQAKVVELRADTALNASEKLYKYILISQCNALSAIMPGMFQKEHDYTELLLPDAMLAKSGIVNDLVAQIHEDNFNVNKQGQIEIVGWLYQYYISEKKDEVFAGLKKNIKINKDTIPAATQLFTPEWIVKYMVENSLGRLWLESHPNADLRANWKYYVDEAEQEPEVAEQLRVLRSQSPVKRPEDLRLIDPCMGSGHILVYAFDVLFQIYQSEGYSERDIPNLILQNNLYGLDIDDRAGQLAYFALMIKARSCNRRFFRQESIPQPMVYTPKGDSELMEFGSLIKVNDLGEKPRQPEQITFDDLDYEKKLNAWNYRSLLAQKYDVVVTNPPYMAPAPSQTDWIKKNYPDSKSDLCVVFIERNFDFLGPNGYLSMITMHSWMFLSSYEKFREKLIRSKDIVNMAHLGARAFEEIGGEVVQTTAFVMRKNHIINSKGVYIRLIDYADAQLKEQEFNTHNNFYFSTSDSFTQMPGNPVAYWVSDALIKPYQNGKTLRELGRATLGMRTGDNERFLRLWHEINYRTFFGQASSAQDALRSKAKWFPYNKGGEYRKWYGNTESVVNWHNDGYEIKENTRRVYPQLGDNLGWKITSEDKYFSDGIAWSRISSTNFGGRLCQSNLIFDTNAPMFFPDDNEWLKYIAGFMCCKIASLILQILNPTLTFQVVDIGNLPLVLSDAHKQPVEKIVSDSFAISKEEWDFFETSWDFKRHPLAQYVTGEYSNHYYETYAALSVVAAGLVAGAYDESWVSEDVESPDIQILSLDIGIEVTRATNGQESCNYKIINSIFGKGLSQAEANDILSSCDPKKKSGLEFYEAAGVIGTSIPEVSDAERMSIIEQRIISKTKKLNSHYTHFSNEWLFMFTHNSFTQDKFDKVMGRINLDGFSSRFGKYLFITHDSIYAYSDQMRFERHIDLTNKLAKVKSSAMLPKTKMSDAFNVWKHESSRRFATLKRNEEELNRIFIDIYGLQDELTPEVEDKDVTVRRADLGRDIRSFISYAVGCMFGRYSLDETGLVFAGGAFDMARYKTFKPTNDNIIPIGSADYFDDDIVVRFIEFVRTVYGDSTLGENLNFIADALYPNGSGTAQERLRRYFLNDFYKNHVKIYQKRPIYWLLDGGKKDGFKALFYLHRYDKYTVARARTDFLHPLQRKYDAEIKRLDMLSNSTDNAREKAAYRKEIDGIQAKIDECRVYDQVVSHIAHQQIELDLDDGVKVNYEKFQGVEVPVDGGKSVTMDLLWRI